MPSIIGPKKARRKLTEEELVRLKEFGMVNLSMAKCAVMLGMSAPTLERIMKKDAATREAKEIGRITAEFNIRKTILGMATGQPAKYDKAGKLMRAEQVPDLTAAKFWAQTQEGFKTADKLELVGKDDTQLQGIVVQIVEPK